MDNFNEDIVKLLFRLKERPICYLGAKSITRLHLFLDGFCWGYNYPSITPFFPDFQKKIELKYKWELNDSWFSILLKVTNDEEKAFDLFYEELQIYLKENNDDIS